MNETDLLDLYAHIRKDKPYHKENATVLRKMVVIETIDARYVSDNKIAIVVTTKTLSKEAWEKSKK